MADDRSWRPKAGEIPQSPGVYRFRDATGRVLYVGKAKILRSRLANYFAPLSSLADRTRRMVTAASSVEWTVVANEFEALQLEFTWIKEFDPPFNVQYKDDKSYPYLAITLGDPVPRVLVTRNRGIPNARYFGPYSRAWAIRETVDALLKAFPMRSCSDGVYRRAVSSGRPCLLGDIGKCAAPCVGRVSPAEHKAIAVDFAAFMSGADQRFVGDVRRRMLEASDAQDFENAARLRDQLQAMQTALDRNAVVLDEDLDADLIGIAEDELSAAVQLFVVRGGRIRGVRAWVVDKELDVDTAELVETTLHAIYTDPAAEPPPKRIYVPRMPTAAASLALLLGELRTPPGKVTITVAQRGEKAQLAQTVETNAKQALMLYKSRRSADFTARSAALADLQEALGMPEAPLRIEGFDVSHLSGTNIVASMVVFEDGLARKDQYRKFSIAESTDDTDSIFQVISRRIARMVEPDEPLDGAGSDAAGNDAAGNDAADHDAADHVAGTDTTPRKRFAYPPQLLVVDGGQPQVQAAARAIRESGVAAAQGIALVGIAKRLEELWLPDSDYPVILPRNSDALFLIQRLRDEAHRFAIGYQRQRRKRDLRSVLAEVPGVGPARVTELLRHFGSVAAVRAADVESIAAVKGIGEATAVAIVQRLREPSQPATLLAP